MPHFSQAPEPWKSFLGELDREATAETRLDCMGGFVATLLYGLPRRPPTSTFCSSLRESNAQRCWNLASGRRASQKVQSVPGLRGCGQGARGLRRAAHRNVPGVYKHLRICALDPYDLALSKLERNIQRDRDDVKHLAQSVPLDLKILKDRYEKELRWQLGNSEREDLTLKLWTEMIEEERSGAAGRRNP